MKKFCIFCGNEPQNKNKEHVIPQWLIKLTGAKNREAYFGVEMSGSEPSIRKYPFSAFSFPSCDNCNAEFSPLENNARKVITKMLNKEAIAAEGISFLLDWMDKVRVGLWLGYNYLDKNMWNVRPHFFIKTRLKKRDRFVIIYDTDSSDSRMNLQNPKSVSNFHE